MRQSTNGQRRRRVTRQCYHCGGLRSCRWFGTHWQCSMCGKSWTSKDHPIIYEAPRTFTDYKLNEAERYVRTEADLHG